MKGTLIGVTAVAHGFLTLEQLGRPRRRRRPEVEQLLGELQALLACWAGACPHLQAASTPPATPHRTITRPDVTEPY